MKQHRHGYAGWALLALVVIVAVGCGKKRPVNVGEADIASLGSGVGYLLKDRIQRGDTVVLFGVPNPVGYTEELEQVVVAGLEHQLKSVGAKVVRVHYKPEEAEAYGRGQYSTLHPAYAAEAWQRYAASSPRAVISLIGWPDREQPFLPKDLTFVGISWTPSGSLRAWTNQFNTVISVVSKEGPVTGRPSRKALKNHREIKEWFEERYEVQMAGGE